MDLEECLELYTNKDISELRKISNNVCIDIAHVAGDMLRYYRLKIKESMTNNIEFVLGRIENENKDYFQLLKGYLLGDNLDTITKIKVEEVLYNFGIMYPGECIPIDLKEYLVNNYKKEFICENKSVIKEKNTYSIYLIFIITLFNLQKYKDKQIEIIESLKNIYGIDNANIILKFMNEFNIISLAPNSTIEVEKGLIFKLCDDKKMMESIYSFYRYFFNESNCLHEFDTLASKIISIQQHELDWVDISKFYNLIEKDSMDALLNFDILEKIIYNSKELIRPTAIGYTVLTNNLSCRWRESKYYVETEAQIIIPHNFNPSLILKLLLKYELICQDYLLVFNKVERKNVEVLNM